MESRGYINTESNNTRREHNSTIVYHIKTDTIKTDFIRNASPLPTN